LEEYGFIAVNVKKENTGLNKMIGLDIKNPGLNKPGL
jgi:hypothetical protein